jgi:hypothetical protein
MGKNHPVVAVNRGPKSRSPGEGLLWTQFNGVYLQKPMGYFLGYSHKFRSILKVKKARWAGYWTLLFVW